MNIKPATTHPLATQEIDGMIDMIKTLIDKGMPMRRMVLYITEQDVLRVMESF